jgi:hypothetical protein
MERYCPSKKVYFEGDKECYYHGEETTCPLCGTPTKECFHAEYTPIDEYDVDKSILESDIQNYGGRVILGSPAEEANDW